MTQPRKTRKVVQHIPKSYVVDWIDKSDVLATDRANRIFNINNTRQATEIAMLDEIPKEIPKANVTEVFALKNKKWSKMGYRCIDCGKTMVEIDIKDKHPLVCTKQLTINKNRIQEEEEDTMPIQRIQKNGEVYYRWGMQGKLYKNIADAEKQAQAAYSSGYREPNKSTKEPNKSTKEPNK